MDSVMCEVPTAIDNEKKVYSLIIFNELVIYNYSPAIVFMSKPQKSVLHNI